MEDVREEVEVGDVAQRVPLEFLVAAKAHAGYGCIVSTRHVHGHGNARRHVSLAQIARDRGCVLCHEPADQRVRIRVIVPEEWRGCP